MFFFPEKHNKEKKINEVKTKPLRNSVHTRTKGESNSWTQNNFQAIVRDVDWPIRFKLNDMFLTSQNIIIIIIILKIVISNYQSLVLFVESPLFMGIKGPTINIFFPVLATNFLKGGFTISLWMWERQVNKLTENLNISHFVINEHVIIKMQHNYLIIGIIITSILTMQTKSTR